MYDAMHKNFLQCGVDGAVLNARLRFPRLFNSAEHSADRNREVGFRQRAGEFEIPGQS